jgi:hypothetical protein
MNSISSFFSPPVSKIWRYGAEGGKVMPPGLYLHGRAQDYNYWPFPVNIIPVTVKEIHDLSTGRPGSWIMDLYTVNVPSFITG